LEIGGSDQLFNMLVGRSLQKEKGVSPQAVMTLPLLVGLDGSRKMSKSYDNYIAFNDSPRDMFGKIMSISDEVMWEYFRLLALKDATTMEMIQKDHPMNCKKRLAEELTAVFYGKERARSEHDSFSQVFSRGEDPESMPEFSISTLGVDEPTTLLNFLHKTSLFESKGEIRRLLKQGAIKLEGNKIFDPDFELRSIKELPQVLKAGKKIFLRVIS